MPDPREQFIHALHDSHLRLLSIHTAFNTIFHTLLPPEKQEPYVRKVPSLLAWAEKRGQEPERGADEVGQDLVVDSAFEKVNSQPSPEVYREQTPQAQASVQTVQKSRRPVKRTRRGTGGKEGRDVKRRKSRGRQDEEEARERIKPLPGTTEVIVFRPVVGDTCWRGPLVLEDLVLSCSLVRARGAHRRVVRRDTGRGYLERNVRDGKRWLEAWERRR